MPQQRLPRVEPGGRAGCSRLRRRPRACAATYARTAPSYPAESSSQPGCSSPAGSAGARAPLVLALGVIARYLRAGMYGVFGDDPFERLGESVPKQQVRPQLEVLGRMEGEELDVVQQWDDLGHTIAPDLPGQATRPSARSGGSSSTSSST